MLAHRPWQMPQFVKGKKPGPGRPKGRLNNKTLEAREFATSVIDSPSYRASVQARAESGTLPPAIEAMLWHYSKGKPPEKIELTGEDGGALQVVFGGRFRPEDHAS